MNEKQVESKNTVPDSIKQVGVTLKYSLLDYVRSRRFFIMLAITVLISVLLTILVAYYRPDSFVSSELSFYNSWWGTSVTYIIILSGIFFGGDAISSEFQNKTGYFGVPNPIRRSSIYIGKWLGAFIASAVILGVFTAITLGNGLYYFSGVPYQFAESFMFALFYLVAVLGFTFFFSSLFKSSTYSIIVTAILFLFAFALIQDLVTSLVNVEPWFILTYGSGIISNVLTATYPANIVKTIMQRGPGVSVTMTSYNATIPEGLAIIAIYFIVTVVIGLILFERKEFN